MTGDSDFDVVRDTWAAFSRDDWEAALPNVHEDAVIVPFGAAMEGGRYVGHEGIKDWFVKNIRPAWEQFVTDPREFRRVGDKILVYGWWRARGRDSGVELEVPATWVVEMRDGRIAGWQTFTERSEAHRAVGLQE